MRAVSCSCHASRNKRTAPSATAKPAANPIAIPLLGDMRLLRSRQGIVAHPYPGASPIRIPAEEQVAIAVESTEERNRLRFRSRATLVEARRIDRVTARKRGRDL